MTKGFFWLRLEVSGPSQLAWFLEGSGTVEETAKLVAARKQKETEEENDLGPNVTFKGTVLIT